MSIMLHWSGTAAIGAPLCLWILTEDWHHAQPNSTETVFDRHSEQGRHLSKYTIWIACWLRVWLWLFIFSCCLIGKSRSGVGYSHGELVRSGGRLTRLRYAAF